MVERRPSGLITEYCKQDVAVTRDVYLFGKDNGYVLFTNKEKKKSDYQWTGSLGCLLGLRRCL